MSLRKEGLTILLAFSFLNVVLAVSKYAMLVPDVGVAN